MRERQIRRMPVADDTGRVIGIVTLGDLAKAVEGPEQIEEILRRISEPHRGRSAPEEKPEEPLDGKGEDKATAA
jgi:CBS-domain-containing membrane protein